MFNLYKVNLISDVVEFTKLKEVSQDIECSITRTNQVGKKWKNSFPPNSYEAIFSNIPALCSFDIILTLIKQVDPEQKNLTKFILKELLVEEYEKYMREYKQNILDILKLEGKQNIIKPLINGQISLSNMIMAENYYANFT